MISTEQIRHWLEEVKDPEIPVLSLVDLGVIRNIETDEKATTVTITPTFVGCPALEVMKNEILDVLKKHGLPNPQVNVSFREPWSSDDITEKGKQALRSFGLAPPQKILDDINFLEQAICPRCNGQNTELKTLFGPTLCRSIHYCHGCKEAFEQFKPL
jgi:ring-1,2-phenylacetyl-CoA epoxidase subunit PaaD